jgi:formylglycine-generating enzyme required for sulfatase activity
MTQITDEMIAQNKVERFVSRFESSYHLLACHVALPLVLTPELVNYLRVQFLKSEGVPWIAEADLLLSDLCRPVGYELYVMDEAVRAYLLQELAQNQKFGEKRIKEIANFLLHYVKHLAKTNPFLNGKELQRQRWGAMLYVNTEETVREIALAISKCVEKAELARLLKITEDFKQKIASSGQFQDFLDYARLCNKSLREPEKVKPEEITSSYQVAGLELDVPESVKKPQIIPELETFEAFEFEAEVATIVFEEETNQDEEKLQQWEFKTPTVNRRGETIKTTTYTASYFTKILTDSVGLEMVAIPGGIFTMGSPENEGSDYERPQHQVTVSPFFMGKYPITQAQWRAIASRSDLKVEIDLDPDPSSFKGNNRPVETVNWYEAVEFCQRLSKLTGRDYRLPSEAEWEYACRGVTEPLNLEKGESYPPFYFGETITVELANYDATRTYADEPKGEESKKTTPVGQFPPNAFGL